MSDQFNFNSSQSPPDASGSQAKSPLSLDLLKNLNDKKTTREGNVPKRRGPKPDSKPALTRRQELNRQAQRTHRERKELYIKALEEEVLRLKEIYSSIAQDREKLVEENRLLKEALAQNGLTVPARRPGGPGGPSDDGTSNQGSNYGVPNIFSPGQASQSTAHSTSPGQSQGGYQNMTGNQFRTIAEQSKQRGIDIEQAGIDFVLALEKPCMAHLPFLMDRANEPAGEPCGHALMASCPPVPFQDMDESRPWGDSHTRVKGEPAPSEGAGPSQGTWELSKADLATLLDLSGQLDLDGEITPVMAWGMIMNHPQFADLQASDFRRLAEELGSKVRCYGFGAVMEDFEFRDAFENVRSTQAEMAY